MFQLSLSTPYITPLIFMDVHKLKVVNKFTYVGSNINRHCNLEIAIFAHVKKATDAFADQKDRVWSKKGVKCRKMAIYTAWVWHACCILLRHRLLDAQGRFHQRCLRSILVIHWVFHMPGHCGRQKSQYNQHLNTHSLPQALLDKSYHSP